MSPLTRVIGSSLAAALVGVALLAPPQAVAADTASISGTVTGIGGPLAGISVRLLDSNLDVQAVTTTANDGAFAFVGLPSTGSGANRLGFFDEVGTYRSEFYDDVQLVGDADGISLADGEAVTGISADLALGGRLSGRVSGAAGGYQDLRVRAIPVDDTDTGSNLGGYSSVDSDGHYAFVPLLPGTYAVCFYDDGAIYADECYDGAANEQAAQRVTVEAGQTQALPDVVLDVGAHITGTVTGPSGAAHIRNVYLHVYAFDPEVSQWLWVTGPTVPAGTTTYDVGGLAADTYRLEFYDPLGIPEFWDNERSVLDAQDIVVSHQAVVTGINAVMDSHPPVVTPTPTPTTTPAATPTVPEPSSPPVPTAAPLPLVMETAPKLRGIPRVGKTLRATPGEWAAIGVTVKYQWYAGSRKIRTATRSRLRLKASLAGKRVGCKVIATAPGHTPTTARTRSVKVAPRRSAD